jgi:hypothetical protein
MMRKLSLLLVAVFSCVAASAQYCGFDKAHNTLLSNNPIFAQRVREADSNLAALISNNANALIINTPNGPVYDIPVVIHVLHTGGAVGTIYNPSDAILQGMITYLNQVYQATYPSYPSASTGGTYFPVQFTLAKRDLNCNSTTGIVRVNTPSLLTSLYNSGVAARYTSDGVMHNGSLGVGEDTLKALSRWDHNDYYNIWVVNKIDSKDGTSGTFVAGYAYLPPAPATLDGTILLATQAVSGSTTLPHEIGHAFSLYHTFQGDDPFNTGSATTCPTNTNCATDGDRVCDTDPHKRSNFNCLTTTINTCTGNPYGNVVHNIMDYSSCQDRFTAGQQARFMNTLLTTRASLISSLGATTLGAAPAASNCQPTMPFPFSATGGVGVYQTKITDAAGNFIMTATSDGGYTADGNLEYIDRACFQRADLTAGSTYTLSVSTGPNREYVRVYMDYNNDGVFNATTELIYSHNGTASVPYEVHTTSYTVPTTGVTTCTPIRMRVITDRNNGVVAAPTPCIALTHGQAEDYSVFIKPAANSSITLTQTAGGNPSCTGTSLSFSASYTGTPTSPSVKIYVNGTQVSATNTYTASTLANNDKVTAKLFFTGACGPDSIVSNSITLIRNSVVAPSVSIAVTAGTNPGCAGQSITFTATPTNGGTGPTYKWFVNSAQVTGATGSSYTTTTLPCSSTVQAQLTSNSTCASTTLANSNIINYTCGPQAVGVTIAVTGGSNPTCAGRNVTFSATPVNGGTSPTYQWYINGNVVTGATGSTFTTNVLANTDSVYVIMASSSTCAATPTVKSPAVYMSVVPNTTPTVTKTITKGSNPGCIGDTLQFTATPANAGSTPAYRWFLNGNIVPFGTTPVYTLPTGGNTGDKIWVRIVASGAASACYTKDTAYSDTTTLDRRPVPNLPLISFIGHQLVSDSANVQWWGPAGLIPGATGPTYTPTVQGNYYAVVINPICGSGKSNILNVSPLTVGNYNMEGVQLFPNPTTGMLTITWSTAATTRITVFTATGKALAHDMATLATRKVVDLSAFPSGIYFVLLQDESGKSGAVRVTVAH